MRWIPKTIYWVLTLKLTTILQPTVKTFAHSWPISDILQLLCYFFEPIKQIKYKLRMSISYLARIGALATT